MGINFAICWTSYWSDSKAGFQSLTSTLRHCLSFNEDHLLVFSSSMLLQLRGLNMKSRLQAKKFTGANRQPDPLEWQVLAGEQGLNLAAWMGRFGGGFRVSPRGIWGSLSFSCAWVPDLALSVTNFPNTGFTVLRNSARRHQSRARSFLSHSSLRKPSSCCTWEASVAAFIQRPFPVAEGILKLF